jgi:hypothetical protein
MKLKWIVICCAALLLLAGRARAAQLFTEKELSLDLFGTYIAPEGKFKDLFKTNIRNGDWGGGVGFNYFLSKNVGIGGDINMPANGGSFVDQALGSLTLRAPLGSSGVAPYVFGGGGRGFDPRWEWFADVGVGLEYRPTHHVGIFIDSRYMWHFEEGSNDRIFFRAGLRLVL